jgi:hypothetical protein
MVPALRPPCSRRQSDVQKISNTRKGTGEPRIRK